MTVFMSTLLSSVKCSRDSWFTPSGTWTAYQTSLQ